MSIHALHWQRKCSRQSERFSAETEEQREVRLMRLSDNQRERLARKSQGECKDRNDANGREKLPQDEREARLVRMSANQRERLATESQDECEARLERMSANQKERLS